MPAILKLFILPEKDMGSEVVYNRVVKHIKQVNFRQIAYIVGFLVYFVCQLERFSEKNILNWDWWIKTKDIALEGLVAFIALDTCITVVVPKLLTKKNKNT